MVQRRPLLEKSSACTVGSATVAGARHRRRWCLAVLVSPRSDCLDLLRISDALVAWAGFYSPTSSNQDHALISLPAGIQPRLSCGRLPCRGYRLGRAPPHVSLRVLSSVDWSFASRSRARLTRSCGASCFSSSFAMQWSSTNFLPNTFPSALCLFCSANCPGATSAIPLGQPCP